MAVPKKRRSKSKKRMKHACWTITVPSLSICRQCQARIRPHRTCSFCGTRQTART